jgi:hypothetical protein
VTEVLDSSTSTLEGTTAVNTLLPSVLDAIPFHIDVQ